MALTETTLSAAFSKATDKNIVVSSATGFSAGYIVRIDDELMQVAKSYVSGTTIPVLPAIGGTAPTDHPSGAAVEVGAASDSEWGSSAAQIPTQFPFVKALRQLSYSASGAITLPDPGSDGIAVLNASGSTVLAMTLAVPTKAMDGCKLKILSRNGTGAHTIDVSGGINGAGSSYNLFTFPAGPVMIELTAFDSVWYTPTHPAWTGTVTLLVGGIA